MIKQGKQVIVLVDDNAVNLVMGKNILKEKYEVFAVNETSALFQVLHNIEADLILLDVEMPDANGFETLKQLKAAPQTQDIPVIFLTSKNDSVSELEGLTLGAIDYISKPFSPPLLLKRIENILAMRSAAKQLKAYNIDLLDKVTKKNNEINELQNTILRIVAELVEFRDDAESSHIERTQKYLKVFINKMIEKNVYAEEVAQWNLNYLIPAAQLYDVGKIAIGNMLLNKPDKFSHEEFELIKKHTLLGVTAIEEIEQRSAQSEFFHYAKIFAGTHHEKWDGTGYPHQLKGKDIPLQGRVMAVIDVYDGLTSPRPYHEPLGHSVAHKIIVGSTGTHFDPVLVEVFKLAAKEFSLIAQSFA